MLLGMSWWASLYVLAVLFMLTEELNALTGDESEEDESAISYLSYYGRLLNGIALIALSVLFFQNLEAAGAKWAFLAAALYSLPFCATFGVQELIEYVKNPTGRDEDTNESLGLKITFIGHVLAFSYYGVGLAIMLLGLLRILTV